MPLFKRLCLATLSILLLSPAAAGDNLLAGKSYILQLSSSQYDSGYGEYLVPPLAKSIAKTGMKAKGGPGADVVVNVVKQADHGAWYGKGAARRWLYRNEVTVGFSPESYDIPLSGKPQFGIKVTALTENEDRMDEYACMVDLAVRMAMSSYKPKGLVKIDGQACVAAGH
ncbi:hypothetical protein [Oryzibacter oryziterrae]|uniref:hypothetical protein n=1 Tax=Oryzibacter oryziterrae TaxID=2766474 RepID=UPI001F279B42|nr:hypothetical protein [Oryzibacter oryziterrae]